MDILPDVMVEKSVKNLALPWVGMTQIQSAMFINDLLVPVQLDVGVDLKESHRGIHMSRLYQLQNALLLQKKISRPIFQKFLQACLESHAEISLTASALIRTSWPVQTLSLKSNLPGFRQYPVEIISELQGQQFKTWLQYEILYSSTCPQSTVVSLEANRLGKGDLTQQFLATPHAQRSRALIRLELSDFQEIEIENLIIESENALGTPVQTSVKKVDELEFAKLNASNLMFCEDAARKLATFFKRQANVQGFHVLCEHQESLHPHNATAKSAYNYSNPLTISFSN